MKRFVWSFFILFFCISHLFHIWYFYVEQCVNHSVNSISLPIILFIAFLYNIPRVVISDTMSCSLTWSELLICLISVSDNERQLLHQVCVFKIIIVIVSLLMKKQPIMCHIKHHPLFGNYYLLYSADTWVGTATFSFHCFSWTDINVQHICINTHPHVSHTLNAFNWKFHVYLFIYFGK